MIDKIKINPENPRSISPEKFKKLKESIKAFPRMLDVRPIVYDENNIVLGGNMRLLALQELVKNKEIEVKDNWFVCVKDLSEAQKKEFIIKDNLGYGEWDWEMIKIGWDLALLGKWGLDIPNMDDIYTRNINIPIYEPKGERPQISEMLDEKKVNELVEKVKESNIDEEIKAFLIKACYRHYVFNYSKIAEYYAHSSSEVKDIMEKLALVIIDYKKAIENGFVELTKYLIDIQEEYDK